MNWNSPEEVFYLFSIIVAAITPLAIWIRWSVKTWIKLNGHCCMKNGCLPKLIKELKKEMKK